MSSTALLDEAKKRKERLKQLKRRAEDGQSENEADSTKRPVFRSYKPESEELAKNADLEAAEPEKVEEHIEDQLAYTKDTTVIDEVDLVTLAPRKIDWDLKRDIQKRLDKLDRKTQKCIAELIRERLSSGKSELLASAVNSSSSAAETGHASDEDD